MAYRALNTRNTSGMNPNFRGMGSFVPLSGSVNCVDQSGALSSIQSPQDALNAVMQSPPSNLNPADWQNQSFINAVLSNIANGSIPLESFSPACQGVVAQNVNVFQTDSGLALGTVSAGQGLLVATGTIAGATAALAGAVTMGIGAIVGVISMIFAHHAAAVKAEQQYGCASIAAVNNAFSVIQKAVSNGTMIPGDAVQALCTVYSQYMNYVQSAGVWGTSPYCNANCEVSMMVGAMVIYWQAQYSNMAAQQKASAASAASLSSSVPTTSTSVAAAAPLSAQTPAGYSSPAVAAGASPSVSDLRQVSTIPTWAWLVAAGLASMAVL